MTSIKHSAIGEADRHGHENAGKNHVTEEVCSLRYAYEAGGNTTVPAAKWVAVHCGTINPRA